MDREREVEWDVGNKMKERGDREEGGGGEGQQNACMGVHRKEIKGREV